MSGGVGRAGENPALTRLPYELKASICSGHDFSLDGTLWGQKDSSKASFCRFF